MRPIDADAAYSKLTELYNSAKGEARKAYSRAIDVICDADTIDEKLTIPDVERVLNEATVFSACFRERITLREFMNKVQKGECNKFRHGRWIEVSRNVTYPIECDCVYKCSLCNHHEVTTHIKLQNLNYCSYCGARMDAGEDQGGGTDNAAD